MGRATTTRPQRETHQSGGRAAISGTQTAVTVVLIASHEHIDPNRATAVAANTTTTGE